MQLIFPEDSLTSRVICLLAPGKPLNATEIVALLSKQGSIATLQRIYQILNTLGERGIILKNKKHFTLRAQWLVELMAWSRETWNGHLRQTSAIGGTPEAGTSCKQHFSNLFDLVSFWTNALVLQFATAKPKAYFEQLPHIWFHLVNAPREKEFLGLMKQAGTRYFIVCGGTSSLDRSYAPFFQDIPGNLRFDPEVPAPAKYAGKYLGVLGPYISVAKLSPSLQRRVNECYTSSGSVSAKNAINLARVLLEPAKITLTISHNDNLARGLRKNFGDFFGLKEADR